MHMRETRHAHNPVDNVRGNAEAVLGIKEQHGPGLKIRWK